MEIYRKLLYSVQEMQRCIDIIQMYINHLCIILVYSEWILMLMYWTVCFLYKIANFLTTMKIVKVRKLSRACGSMEDREKTVVSFYLKSLFTPLSWPARRILFYRFFTTKTIKKTKGLYIIPVRDRWRRGRAMSSGTPECILWTLWTQVQHCLARVYALHLS